MPKPRHHYESVPCPEMARVALYLRYSHQNQAASSIEKQRMNCHTFTARYPDWHVADGLEYREPAQTAKHDDIARRPQFARLLADASQDKYDVVIVDSIDRWGRAEAAQFTSLGILRDAGIYWATADGQWNSENIRLPGHAQAFMINVSLAAQTSRDTSKKVTDGKVNRAQHGYHANSQPPFGYTRADPTLDATGRIARRDLVPDANFPLLGMIADWRMAGWSCAEIAAELNRQGHRYPYPARGPSSFSMVKQHDRPFLTSTIRSIVTNPFYAEYAPGGGVGTIMYDRRGTKTLVQGRHVAAWTRETWDRMQQVSEQLNHSPNATRTRRHHYPLAGIVTCPHCGQVMRSQTHVHQKSSGKRRYGCRFHLAASPRALIPCTAKHASTACEVVEAAFGALLAQLADHAWETQLEAFLDDTTDLDAAPDRRAHLEEAQRRLNVQYRLQAIGDDEYEREIRAIQNELRLLPTPISAERRKSAARAAAARIADIAVCWEKAPLAEKQQMAVLLLQPEGLQWDHDARRIVAIRPHDEFLPAFAAALSGWQMDDDWLREGDENAYQRVV
jgi:DNA invertase Pin-like site-specific DNA recombinase